ncbi:GerMN domain-containing protein [Geobacter sp. DSM 9736]|uniref:GerMN domain-containing protein n=1 Tax=Geobacter sp. DSM 9736 TaxID=1277350 RepID=UPI000B508E9D|nr:GerMN domain-containing protein [Geobacter sp. DSM 9736]SNB47887.1 Sporulation and spore germination [Geobacter sp. DSM 9736]
MKRVRSRRKTTLIFLAFLVCAGFLGLFMLKRYETRHPQVPAVPVPQQSGSVSLTLFFAAPDGSGLIREGRNVEPCSATAECIGRLIEELASGPLGELGPTIPPNTVARGVNVAGDMAVIDLEESFVEGLPPGSSAEMMAAYSLVNSIAVNFPQISKVRLLVGGKGVETLKEHLDIREPLSPDFSLEKNAAAQ